MKIKIKSHFVFLFSMAFLFFSCKEHPATVGSENKSKKEAPKETFTNPLLASGADPYSTYKDGYYYYTHTVGDRLVLWKAKSLARLKNAEKKTVWRPPENTMYSNNIWAPEVHFINGKWYIYFAADDGDNKNHRMYVIENSSYNPLEGEWEFKGKIAATSDKWAIDGNISKYKDQLYMIWSGWEGDINGRQDIYIAKMKNPWEIEGRRIKISSPEYEWERIWQQEGDPGAPKVYVNEGPQFLMHNDDVFIVYSASGCWTDSYSLGLLSLKGDDLLKAENWKKHPEPIFKQSPENGVYAPGHNSFFKSPDGTEDWILYHANSNSGEGCGGKRSPRMQKISWSKDGTPDLGIPVREGKPLALPSEE